MYKTKALFLTSYCSLTQQVTDVKLQIPVESETPAGQRPTRTCLTSVCVRVCVCVLWKQLAKPDYRLRLGQRCESETTFTLLV